MLEPHGRGVSGSRTPSKSVELVAVVLVVLFLVPVCAATGWRDTLPRLAWAHGSPDGDDKAGRPSAAHPHCVWSVFSLWLGPGWEASRRRRPQSLNDANDSDDQLGAQHWDAAVPLW